MWFLSLIILIFILGIIILVHEFGHFIWAKKFGVHIYEFSIGMGPIIHKHTGKDGIDYNIRAFPIGGFVSMAGEVYEDDDSKKIKKEKFMCNRPWWQRVIILIAGVVNNFILALVILFFMAAIWGNTKLNTLDPIVDEVVEGSPMADANVTKGDKILSINGYGVNNWNDAQLILEMEHEGEYAFVVKHQNGIIEDIKVKPSIEKDKDGKEHNVFGIKPIKPDLTRIFSPIESVIWENGKLEPIDPVVSGIYKGSAVDDVNIAVGDRIISINGYKVSNWDAAQIRLAMKHEGAYTFGIKHQDGKIEDIKITPKVKKDKEGNERREFGMEIATQEIDGVFDMFKYAFKKFGCIVESMWLTITGLITGKISTNALSGPVGMYQVIDQSMALGISRLIYITAFLSINVGFINILPFPAFDGGRVFFLIVEKIKGSPVNSKFENTCHMIGFFLLLALMIYITIHDIIRLF